MCVPPRHHAAVDQNKAEHMYRARHDPADGVGQIQYVKRVVRLEDRGCVSEKWKKTPLREKGRAAGSFLLTYTIDNSTINNSKGGILCR